MKKADIAMIVLIASVSVLIAYFVARGIFGDFYSGNRTVKTIERIEPTIVDPDPMIFNSDAINPAVRVEINSSDNN